MPEGTKHRATYSTVHILGALLGAMGFEDEDALFARWEINSSSPHWSILDGSNAGQTQVGVVQVGL